MFRNRPVSLALVGLFVWLTGCTSYKQIEPAEVADYGRVRVTLTNGERETIHDPRVDADSIRGLETVEEKRYYSNPLLVIPLDQVSKLEIGSFNPLKTCALVFGVAAVLAAVAAIACCPGLNPLGGPDSVSW